MADASELLDRALVIDGCQFAEGSFPEEKLVSRGVDALVFTVPGRSFAEAALEIGRIHEIACGNGFAIVRKSRDLGAGTGVILAFQDPAPIENRIENLRVFYELGVRVVQLTYNKGSYIGTGCAETEDRGLTDFGREIVQAMNRLGMVIDLSHCSRRTALEAIGLSEHPAIFSHACARALADNPRNRADEEIQALAEKGGVIGVTPWGPICWKRDKDEPPSLDDYLDHVEHVARLVGVDHVGFGTDNTVDGSSDEEGIHLQSRLYPQVVGEFDRRVGTSPKVRYARGFEGAHQLPNVVSGLFERGFSEEDVSRFLGRNFRRVFETVWRQ